MSPPFDLAAAGVAVAAGAALLVVIVAAWLRPSAHRTIRSEIAARADNTVVDGTRRRVGRLAGRIRRERSIHPAAVADWCDDVSRHVRAGTPLREALRGAVPRDDTLRRLSAPLRLAIDRGEPTDDATRRLLGRDRDLDVAVTVLATAARLGGSPAAAIDRTAAALRQRSADRGDRLVQSAQARLSAHVLTVLPVAILGVLLVADADVRHAIVRPTGFASVAAGLGLNTIGWCWMRRVIGR